MDYRQQYPPSYWKNFQGLCRENLKYGRKFFDLVYSAIQEHELQSANSPFGVSMPRVELRSRYDSERLCQKWGLGQRAWRWLEWLATHWDPQEVDLPPHEPQDIYTPFFYPWTIEVEEAPHPHNWKPWHVTLTLKPGVSLRSAQQAVKQAG